LDEDLTVLVTPVLYKSYIYFLILHKYLCHLSEKPFATD